jgi:hypothetical protein
MLSQFTLSLSKGSIAVGNVPSFSSFMLVFVFPPFALMQKVEPKNQGKPEPLRASCHPRTAALNTTLIFHLLQAMKHVSFYLQLFQNPMPFLSSVTNDRRCIPLSFF